MSTKNIYTAVVVMLALVMVLVALMATGVIGGKEEEKTELQSYIATRVVQASETNEYGEITYYTMLEEYLELGVSSDHTYKKTTKPADTETESPFVEQDSFVYVTNEDGSPVYGENGKPVTEVVKVTVDKNSITTQEPAPPETAYQQVTDENGNPVLDENGQPVTQTVTVESTTAEATTDRWAQEDEGFKGIRDDELANNIIDQINSDRESYSGRAPLAAELNGVARSDSSFSAMKGFEDKVSGRGMTFVTTYGGSQLYADIARAMSSKIHSDSATQIGVGVFKANNKYYTTVIIE